MTITGGSTNDTHTLTTTSNIITDGTRTLTSGIVSSVATFKALAGTGGNSSIIKPNSITTSNVDGTTSTNTSSITPTSISTIGTYSNDYCKITPSGSTSLIEVQSQGTDYNTNLSSGMLQLLQNASIGTGIQYASSLVFRRTNQTSVGVPLGVLRFIGYSTPSSATFEYGRITSYVKTQGSGNEDGSILFSTQVNSTLTDMLELNGDEQQINAFKALDMNNNAIVSSTGSISINATSSSGTGNINITPKSAGYIILSNLPTSATGLPTGALYNSAGVLMVAP